MNDAGQRDDRHLARAAADIHNHAARRLRYRQANPDRRRHRLLDQENLSHPGRMRRVLHRALFDLRDVAGHGDHNSRLGVLAPEPLRADLVDEVAEHRLRNVEVGDDAALHRTDGHDVSRRSAKHALRLVAHSEHALRPLLNRDNGRLSQHDSPVLRVHEGVRRAEIYADVGRKESSEF